ncbi:MAG: hypothetical protein EOO86_05285 [Pedobacter sp.]|nr:MAG: hypothetical protein EOO86_05285 [Pedobacter sp.]
MVVLVACRNENKQIKKGDKSVKQIEKKLLSDSNQKATDKANLGVEKQEERSLTTLNEDALNKIYIPLKSGDSSFYLHADIKSDHRIFGYAQPNTNSEKMILFSVFTNEVQNNPFKCKYGAYYEINKGNQNFSLKYNGKKNEFIVAELTDSLNKKRDIYFEKKWIEIE